MGEPPRDKAQRQPVGRHSVRRAPRRGALQPRYSGDPRRPAPPPPPPRTSAVAPRTPQAEGQALSASFERYRAGRCCIPAWSAAPRPPPRILYKIRNHSISTSLCLFEVFACLMNTKGRGLTTRALKVASARVSQLQLTACKQKTEFFPGRITERTAWPTHLRAKAKARQTAKPLGAIITLELVLVWQVVLT